MARDKASFLIQNHLKELSIQQLQCLHNLYERKDFSELISVFKKLIDGWKNDSFLLDETDPHLAVKKKNYTGQVNGIIILKQLFEHSSGELNDRMKEK